MVSFGVTSFCTYYLLLIWFILLFQNVRSYIHIRYHVTKWSKCDMNNSPFLTEWNFPKWRCVRRCAKRGRCRAVNFYRQQRKCDYLSTEYNTNAGMINSELGTNKHVTLLDTKSCIYIRKTDIDIPEEVTTGCEKCTIDQICILKSYECHFAECMPLEVPNAKVIGNIALKNAVVRIVPNDGYMLDSTSASSRCMSNGKWSNVPTSILKDCGDPPAVPAATVSIGHTFLDSVRTYTCWNGYDVVDQTIDMTIECRKEYSSSTITIQWSPILFECIEKTCELGWHKHDQSCYKFNQYRVGYSAAMRQCGSFGAHLVTIETPAENGFLTNYLTSTFDANQIWWIGIDDRNTPDSWVYTHSNTPVTFVDWAPGEPNMRLLENCACRGGNNGWFDVGCKLYTCRVICEKTYV